MATKNISTIGFSIIGSSGNTSYFNTDSLFLKSDIQSQDIGLFTRTKPTGVQIPFDTNWNPKLNSINLNSSLINNNVSSGEMSISWRDFSSSKDDTFYTTHQGQIGVDYYVDSSWQISDIDLADGIMAVGTSDWISQEKIILDTPITRGMGVKSIVTGKYDRYEVGQPQLYPITYTTTTLTVSTYTMQIIAGLYSGQGCYTSAPGNLSISYTDIDGNGTVTVAVQAAPWTTTVSITSSVTPTKAGFTGAGDPCLNTMYTSAPFQQTKTIADPIPDGAVQVGNYYYFPVYNYVYKPFTNMQGAEHNLSLGLYIYDAVFNSGVTCPCGDNPKSAIIESKMFRFGVYGNGLGVNTVIQDTADTVKLTYELCNPVSGNYVSGIRTNVNPITGQNGAYLGYNPTIAVPNLTIDGIKYNFNDCFGIRKYTGGSYENGILRYSNNYVNQAVAPGSLYLRNSFGETYSAPTKIKTSNFLLTNTRDLLQIFQSVNAAASSSIEYFDYSDIFFEVKYSLPLSDSGCQGVNNKLAQDSMIAYERSIKTDVTSENQTKLYRFDGYITTDQFLNDDINFSKTINVADDTDPTWKILFVPSTKEVMGVVLSSYIDWRPSSTIHQTNQYPPSGNFITESSFPQFSNFDYKTGKHLIPAYDNIYSIISQKDIRTDSIKVYKLVNFPNCGKVDLYSKNTGLIAGINSNQIGSFSHGLNTGDRIKIVGVLSDTLQTNLNGTFYVGVLTKDVFNIYTDQNLLNIVTPANFKTFAGASWAAIDGKAWKYNTTLYSPMGKNGYSCDVPQLVAYNENLKSGIYERTIYIDDSKIGKYDPLGNYWPDNQKYPQGFFNGIRSFNNFYPYKRYSDDSKFILSIVNGNRFGDTVKIKQLDSTNYILMITEPGASESFEAVDVGKKNNKKVLPTYLPYGRIHFYKITKSQSAYTINYLSSVNKDTNPWADLETAILSYRKLNPDLNYSNTKNIDIAGTDVQYLFPKGSNSNYWYGARFSSWTKDTLYNLGYNYEMPNDVSNPTEYPYIDYLGKSADFTIDKTANVIHCVASTNVKNNDFTNLVDSRINYPDPTLQAFTFSLSTNTITENGFTTIPVSSVSSTTSYFDQQNEFINFGECVRLTDAQKLYFGWPGTTRGYDNIYYYQKSGNNYGLQQIITGVASQGLGRYLSVNDDYMVANQRSYYDDNNNLTTNPLDYLVAYKHYSNINKYFLVSRLSPTIDTSNPQYKDINLDEYEITTNLSYDNTSDNSATYIMDLTGKFELHNDELFVRDWYEISRFRFDSDTETFHNDFHKLAYSSGVLLNTANTILRVKESNSPATFDSANIIDDGHFAKSLEIVDGSQYFNGTYSNYLSTFDVQDLNYVPLFLQTSIPKSKAQNLFTHGLNYSSGNTTMFVKVPELSSGLMTLHVELPVKRESVDLIARGHIRFDSNINLTMWQNTWNSGIPLHTYYDPRFSAYMPLSVALPVVVGRSGETDQFGNPATNIIYDNVIQLYLESHHTGIPNGSSNMPIYLKTIEYDDYAASMNLGMNVDLIQATSSSGNMSAYIMSSGVPSGYATAPLSISGQAYKSDTYMPLFIDRPIIGIVPLIVYSTVSATGLPLYISGRILKDGSINLAMGSGYGKINKNVTIFSRGSSI